jgi:hypothetical protein
MYKVIHILLVKAVAFQKSFLSLFGNNHNTLYNPNPGITCLLRTPFNSVRLKHARHFVGFQAVCLQHGTELTSVEAAVSQSKYERTKLII